MKTSQITTRIVSLLFFLISVLTFGQEKDRVMVTLVVDIALLGDDPNDPGGCTLMANPGILVLNAGDPKEFTTVVDNGSKIKWVGTTTTGEVVKILKIQYLKGDNAFNKEKLRRCLFGKKIHNRVRRATSEGKDYVYQIKFKVKKRGRYYLDPKIRVN